MTSATPDAVNSFSAQNSHIRQTSQKENPSTNNSATQIPEQPSPKNYKTKLDIFEGPVDLLLYLVRKNELDIFDIPIIEITNQYLDFMAKLESQQLIDASNSNEFIVMAAHLIHMKSARLLPGENQVINGEDFEEGKLDLIRHLIEYSKYKDIADFLQECEESQQKVFSLRAEPIGITDNNSSHQNDTSNSNKLNLNMLKLLDSFQSALDKLEKNQTQIIKDEVFTVKSQITYILALLETNNPLKSKDLFKIISKRAQLIAAFLAILELTKVGKILINFNKNSLDIEISLKLEM